MLDHAQCIYERDLPVLNFEFGHGLVDEVRQSFTSLTALKMGALHHAGHNLPVGVDEVGGYGDIAVRGL